LAACESNSSTIALQTNTSVGKRKSACRDPENSANCHQEELVHQAMHFDVNQTAIQVQAFEGSAREHVAFCRQRAALVAVALEEALTCAIATLRHQQIVRQQATCSARCRGTVRNAAAQPWLLQMDETVTPLANCPQGVNSLPGHPRWS